MVPESEGSGGVEGTRGESLGLEKSVEEASIVAKNGHAIVSVSDQGGGVPEDELENLFRPFYRVGEARDRSSGGTGLGLAIAEQAIKAHNGKISARNSAAGLVVEIALSCTKPAKPLTS